MSSRQALLTLYRRAQQGRDTKPVFIIGQPRSGTSIVFRSLLSHSAFATRPSNTHLDLTESFAVQRLMEHATFTSPGIAPELKAFLYQNHELFFEFASALSPAASWRRTTLPLTRRWPRSVTLQRLSLNIMALRAYVAISIDARKCSRLVEKTPHNVPFANLLLAAFPGAKLLFMARHPLDTLASYWRRSGTDPGATWTRISVDNFCDAYASSVDLALGYARRRPEDFMIIRYERFTEAPVESFAEICTFVDVPFMEEAVTTDPGGYGAFTPDPHLYGAIVSRTKTWKALVPPDLARAVETRLAGAMFAMGFERYT